MIDAGAAFFYAQLPSSLRYPERTPDKFATISRSYLPAKPQVRTKASDSYPTPALQQLPKQKKHTKLKLSIPQNSYYSHVGKKIFPYLCEVDIK